MIDHEYPCTRLDIMLNAMTGSLDLVLFDSSLQTIWHINPTPCNTIVRY